MLFLLPFRSHFQATYYSQFPSLFFHLKERKSRGENFEFYHLNIQQNEFCCSRSIAKAALFYFRVAHRCISTYCKAVILQL